MKQRLGEIIARRNLTCPRTGKRVAAQIGKPVLVTTENERTNTFGHISEIPKGHWYCPFKVTGLTKTKDIPGSVYAEMWGKDSMGALLNAMGCVADLLEKPKQPPRWKYAMGLDNGFPIFVYPAGLKNKKELAEKFSREVGKYMKKSGYLVRSPYEIQQRERFIETVKKQVGLGKRKG